MQSLWDWLGDHAWVVAWLGTALVLGMVELTTLDFIFLMLAVGAGSGALTAALGGGFLVQLTVASLVSAALLIVVRPIAKRRLLSAPELAVGGAALIGSQGLVIEQVAAGSGLVKLGGEVWTARPYDGHSVFEPGARVGVAEIDGATALVHAYE
ncbi:NfeD family protein [Haloactinopolyspora sp.]|uniref:NfeD family protein n=1 Tax=Haloactinopolyspora sp. TaxID=1966353 RepID=UPI002634D709|nr:NfeD family protein [Haloactinopolyspora sp.]